MKRGRWECCRGGSARSAQRHQHRNRLGGDAFAAAREAEALGRGGLHADRVRRQAKQLGGAHPHGFAVGFDLRRFADHRDVTAVDPVALFFGERLGVFQEDATVGVFPTRVRGWEVVPDIAKGDGAEDGIGQRVPAGIRVGMAFELGDMRDGDAAESDVITGFELMHIEAFANARGAGRGKQACQHVEILGIGDLGKADGTGNQLDPRARCFDSREVIDKVCSGRVERGADGAEAEGLGRLDAMQGAAVNSAEPVTPLQLQGVGDGQGRGRGIVRLEGRDERRDRACLDAGPGRVMDQNDGVVGRAEDVEAAEHGLGAGRARFGAGEPLARAWRAKVCGGDNDHIRN